tara:strand:- start:83 stop:1120 length:1038 start_codon:yes stop_codon:yes gene_type:complete
MDKKMRKSYKYLILILVFSVAFSSQARSEISINLETASPSEIFRHANYLEQMMMYDGADKSKLKEESMYYFLVAAERGHVKAQRFFGGRALGFGKSRNVELGIKWLKIAASNGNVPSMSILGGHYSFNVVPDYYLAMEWYKKASKLGDGYSSQRLGELYEKGLGIEQDFAAAAKWYELAMKQSANKYGIDKLAKLYKEGKGVPKNLVHSLELYREALITQDNARGLNTSIADFYENGLGVEKDLRKAASFYREDAMRAYYLAQLRLGQMYEEGRGVPQDLNAAFALYSIAATCLYYGALSTDEAINSRERVLSKFSGTESFSAQKSIKTYREAIIGNFGLPEACL